MVLDKRKFHFKVKDLQRIEDITKTTFDRIYTAKHAMRNTEPFINNYLTQPEDYL